MRDVVLRDESAAARAKYNAASSRSLHDDQRGQGMAEYGLILGLIAILCIAAVLFLGGNIQGLLSNAGSSI
jgi:pilus assembly protein Flp/PilA